MHEYLLFQGTNIPLCSVDGFCDIVTSECIIRDVNNMWPLEVMQVNVFVIINI